MSIETVTTTEAPAKRNNFWSDLRSAPRSEFLSTPVLAILILLVPIGIVMLGGGRGETAVFGMVMFSGPILLGLMAQRMKGRTGVVWCLLSFVVIFVANLLAGGGDSPDVLARVIMFGALPMAIIIATLPRRKS